MAKYDATFKNIVLNDIRNKAIGKAMVLKNKLKYTLNYGMEYRGVTFPCYRSSLVVPATEEQITQYQLDSMATLLNQWEDIEFTLIKWLNESKANDLYYWVPHLKCEESPEYSHITESDEYLTLEALISLNEVLE